MALQRVETDAIEDDAVTTAKIAPNAVAAADIAADAITNVKVAAGAAIAVAKISGLGTAATLTAGTAANNVVQLDGSGRLPAVSGANLTGVSTDTSAMENNIAILAFKTQSANNLAKFNLIDQVIDEYKDATGVTLSSISQAGSTATAGYLSSGSDLDAGGTAGSWGAGNTSENVGGGSAMTYGTGDDLGMNNNSYNYNFISHSSGTDSTTGTAMVVGNCRVSFTGVSVNQGASATGTAADYYEWGLMTALSAAGTSSLTSITSDGIYIAFGGNGEDIRIIKKAGTGETLLSTYTTSWTNSQEISLCRNGSTMYLQVDGVTVYTVGSSDFNSSAALKFVCSFGRGQGARAFNDCAFRYSATSLKGISGSFNAAGTATSTANTALSAPTTGDICMLIENVSGTATLNTDLKAYVSRNGGGGWDQATLVDKGSWGTNKKIVSANNVAFSNSASGTDMRYKIEWANQADGSKETRVHATSLAWA